MNHTDRMQELRLELPAQCMPVRFFACKPWESRCVATFPIPSCSLMEALQPPDTRVHRVSDAVAIVQAECFDNSQSAPLCWWV